MTEQSVEIIEGGTGQASVQSSPVPPGGLVTLFGSDDPAVVIEKAGRTARSLMAVVNAQGLSVRLDHGQDFLKIEAWTLLGTMVGVFAVPVWTRPVKDGDRTVGWEARVEARTIAGAVVGAGESMCTRDETTTKRNGDKIHRWAEADEHALRSMAQTRAASKALSLPLRFIATLAGYSGTPYEEMPAKDRTEAPQGTSAPPQHAPAYGGNTLPKRIACKECDRLGLKSKKGYPSRFWPDKTTCDGGLSRNGKFEYSNHPIPVEDIPDVEPIDDPTDIPM